MPKNRPRNTAWDWQWDATVSINKNHIAIKVGKYLHRVTHCVCARRAESPRSFFFFLEERSLISERDQPRRNDGTLWKIEKTRRPSRKRRRLIVAEWVFTFFFSPRSFSFRKESHLEISQIKLICTRTLRRRYPIIRRRRRDRRDHSSRRCTISTVIYDEQQR